MLGRQRRRLVAAPLWGVALRPGPTNGPRHTFSHPTSDCAGLRRLQSLPRGAVHRLRLLSIVGAGEQSWTTAGPARPTASPAAAAQLAPLPADGTPAAGVKPLEASNSRSSSWWRDGFAGDSLPAAVADGVPAEPPTAEAAAGAPAGQLAVSPGSHLAQREQQAAGGTGDGASQLLLWGELYCRERPRGLAALLPRRRADMGERLVAQVRPWPGSPACYCGPAAGACPARCARPRCPFSGLCCSSCLHDPLLL